MKSIFILLTFSLSLISCKKDSIIPDSEIPAWLRTRIAVDEMKIEADPQSGLDVAAWIRYEFRDEFFYEYHNMLSSSGPEVYNTGGIKVNSELPYTYYNSQKCCKKFVWKGPAYIGF